jgi:hypothetical protein
MRSMPQVALVCVSATRTLMSGITCATRGRLEGRHDRAAERARIATGVPVHEVKVRAAQPVAAGDGSGRPASC